MPLEPLPGFKSFATHHCVTGSLRHVYEQQGFSMSEDMLLGLGSGVGFIYWHMKGMTPMYGGRANVGRPGEEGLEKTAGRRTGVQVEAFRTNSGRKAEAGMLDMLAAGQPVMIMVDMGFLPYLNLPEGYHFGGHAVVVAGYDAKSGQVLVADRDEPLHPVSLSQLARARGSTFKPFAPQNAWYSFDFTNARPPQAPDIWQAIREVAEGMLRPPIANIGVKGIRKAAQSTRKWPEAMDDGALREACFNAFIFIDATGGTGGGIFRYMYGRFLVEAADIVGESRLFDVGQQMREIGDLWQQVALAFREASEATDPASLIPVATKPLLLIAEREERAWTTLHELASVAGV